ncbi:type IV leader peptidase family protein [Krasilnikovia cinnamomea]|uniref:Type IV leader peptidase family protein n=1 Tax=Krasilnikovia cinnamomea TaxID=349313 RepID=A0A4Q7ZL37_9ACTN|nr:prepilin peptidase [Krasilnikovia cinnamomea]RZU51291.1 type IV leader peptidase family protein [Krasilnikovia cinnamomea]
MTPDFVITGAVSGALAAGFVPHTAGVWIADRPRSPRTQWLGGLLAGGCTTLVAAVLSWRHPPHGSREMLLLAAWMVFTIVGMSLAWIDVVIQRLPTRLIGGAAAAIAVLLCLAAALAGQPAQLLTPVLAATILGGGYTALVAVGASRMGMGDVRLAALTGLPLGTLGWEAVILGAALPFLLALPFAIVAATRARLTGVNKPLPFGPFLITATIFASLVTR